MATTEQKKKLLKAKIAVALHDELGRVPKKEEIEQVFLLSRVMYKAILGLHFQRQQQKETASLLFFSIFAVFDKGIHFSYTLYTYEHYYYLHQNRY